MSGSHDLSELLDAIQEGSLRRVSSALSKNPELIEEKDQHDLCPLHWACIAGSVGVVNTLLSVGADPVSLRSSSRGIATTSRTAFSRRARDGVLKRSHGKDQKD